MLPAFNRLFLIASLLLSSLISSLPLVSPVSAQTIATNTLVKGDGPAVYYLSPESKRYVFPNERIFKSWYADFSGVQTLSASGLASFPIGGNIKYRPGTRLVKIVSDPTVYGIGSGGTLHALASESTARNLYGPSWATRVDDLPDAFFFDYTIAGAALDGTTHPDGTLFTYSGQSTYYILLKDATGLPKARPISSALRSAWRYDTANALMLSASQFPYQVGDALTSADAYLAYAHQPKSANATTPQPEPEPEPAPSPATLTVSPASGLTTTMQAVRQDPSATIYKLTLKGDATHALTMTALSATFYIDAGNVNTDFGQGFDEDGTVLWSVGQVLKDVQLKNADTGAVLDTETTVDSLGRVTFNTALEIAAKTQVTLEIAANITNTPANARVSADINPASDIQITSGTATEITMTPTTSLNKGLTPSISVALKPFGKLQVKSVQLISNQFQTLSADYAPMKLQFTSIGEPFKVNSLSLTTTNDGSAYLSVRNLTLTYTDSSGVQKISSVNEIENGRFHFINLDIAVPKGGTAEAIVTVQSNNLPDVFGNMRLQFDVLTDNFRADSVYSQLEYRSSDFPNQNKLSDATAPGPLIVYREASMAFSPNANAPKGSVTRFAKTTVLTFNVTGKTRETRIRRLTFKLETNDSNEEGDDNDLLERYANRNPFDVIGLYAHGPVKEDRGRLVPITTTFAIFDKSAALLDTTPDGLQTGGGDYGLFILDFGSNPITLSPGQTLTLDLDIDTSLFSTGDEWWVRARLLGDMKSTSVSEANLLWDDGTNISSTSYLLEGLDLSSALLSIN